MTNARQRGGARSDSSLAKPLSTSFSESRRGIRREKVFGPGRCVPLDRNAKCRVMMLARALMRRTEVGKAYGQVTAKALAVLQALLWGFHNCHSGRCFPSYETIADRAGCARSTVAIAIKALEQAGVLSWVNRLVRVRERCTDLFGNNGVRWRVIRTSNAYAFRDPYASEPSKSESWTRTPTQKINQTKIANSGPPWLPLWTEDERVFGVSVVPLGRC
jgi:hypothetical protein